MNITHDSTIKIAKGWQTIINILEEDKPPIGLVIRHKAPTAKIIESDPEKIEAALARENIFESRIIIDEETALEIEEPLINWLSRERGLNWQCIRWEEEKAVGFNTEAEALAYDERQKETSNHTKPAERKTRIMLG